MSMIENIFFVKHNTGGYYYGTSEEYDEYDIWESLPSSFLVKEIVSNREVSIGKRNSELVDVYDIPTNLREQALKNDFLNAICLEIGWEIEELLDVEGDPVPEDNWGYDNNGDYNDHTTDANYYKTASQDSLSAQLDELDRIANNTTKPSSYAKLPVDQGFYGKVQTSGTAWTGNTLKSEEKSFYNTNDNNNKTKTNSMSNSLFKGLNLEFGKYSNPNIALSFAGIAVKRRDGQWVTFDRNTQTLTEVGDLKFDMDFYRVPVQTLNAGDITEIDGQIYIVEEIKENGNISCINPGTGSKSTKIKRNNLFNMYFYTKIVSMFDMFNGGGLGAAPAAGQAASPFGAMNPMMLMAMSGDKGGDSGNLMEMMMMSQLFGGAQGANPFAAFGQPQAAVEAPVAATAARTAKK